MRRPIIAAIILIASLVTPALAQSSGTFATTGSLNTPRFNHTATLLANGQVLVAGGTGPSSTAIASAELYNPATGTWTKTGNMTTPRSGTARPGQMATLLSGPNCGSNCDKVLVAGGDDASNTPVASAELFDPSTGKWTLTGSMSTARDDGTATLLPNGQVLVAGGGASSERSAELYNPATGTWTQTGSMTTDRVGHIAVLLQTDKVLVAGGINNSGDIASAELYDPATGKWTATGSMTTTRLNPTATLLTGSSCGADCGKVLVAGGGATTTELYDPASGQWNATSFSPGNRQDFSATGLASGKVLFAGGLVYRPSAHLVATVNLFDPSTGAAEATGQMLVARRFQSATLLQNGQVLVAGGATVTSTGDHGECELYAP